MSTRLEESTLTDQIAERMGDHDGARVRRAARAVVDAIFERLPTGDIASLADELPRTWLDGSRDEARLLAKVDCFAEVALRAELSESGAREYALVVAQVLAEHLSPETLGILHRHLPAPWPTLLEPASHAPSAVSPPHRQPPTGERHTIANGRPGSLQPIIDLDAEPAQAGSVARGNDPHRDTKLSSGAPHTGRRGV